MPTGMLWAASWRSTTTKCRCGVALHASVSRVHQPLVLPQIIQLTDGDKEDGITALTTFSHPYPCTKIMWAPEKLAGARDLLATTGDYLRLWHCTDEGDMRMEALMNNNPTSEYCAPLTSADWNKEDHNVIATCSVDTTVAVWDIPTKKVTTQLIAHDKDVFDMAWMPQKVTCFGTVGADGSMRTFDLRTLEHSTIMYESPGLEPIVRLEWNPLDGNYCAMTLLNKPQTVVLDLRFPAKPVAELGSHVAAANAAAWAPHSAAHVLTVSDDNQALIWDLSVLPDPVSEPILAYTAKGEVNTVQWGPATPEWVGITYKDTFQLLRV